MRLENLSESGSVITCMECKQLVKYYNHGMSGLIGWYWACAKPGDFLPELDLGHMRALNSCRPCPWISCRHHLYLEVHPDTGALKINFKGIDPDQMEESCSADIADRGGLTLKEVCDMIRLTRERIRQVEVSGIKKIQRSAYVVESSDFVTPGWRR